MKRGLRLLGETLTGSALAEKSFINETLATGEP